VHRATLTTFAGIAPTICPAPNHAVALDLGGALPPSFMIEPPLFICTSGFPTTASVTSSLTLCRSVILTARILFSDKTAAACSGQCSPPRLEGQKLFSEKRYKLCLKFVPAGHGDWD
jgi:hypothetical protein